MTMGKHTRPRRQRPLWIAAPDFPARPEHPFYGKLQHLLEKNNFDDFVEKACERFYAHKKGRPSLPPGAYFRILLVAYFEDLPSERAVAWRVADSISLRHFLGLNLHEATPGHTTLSRTRRLLGIETHREVLCWVLDLLAREGVRKGRVMAVHPAERRVRATAAEPAERGSPYRKFLAGLVRTPEAEKPKQGQLKGLNSEEEDATVADSAAGGLQSASSK